MTLRYAPPEVLQNITADFSGDIWSLGCSIYEVVTGKAAFQSEDQKDTEDDIKKRIENEWPEVPKYLDRPLIYLIGRMLCKEREYRPKAYEICEMKLLRDELDKTTSSDVI